MKYSVVWRFYLFLPVSSPYLQMWLKTSISSSTPCPLATWLPSSIISSQHHMFSQVYLTSTGPTMLSPHPILRMVLVEQICPWAPVVTADHHAPHNNNNHHTSIQTILTTIYAATPDNDILQATTRKLYWWGSLVGSCLGCSHYLLVYFETFQAIADM